MAKSKKRHHQPTDVDNSCLLDGCLYLDVFGFFGDRDGCANNDSGCLDFDGGCFDFGDPCSMVFGGSLRLIVIIGLIFFGDWDFKNRTAKARNMID